MARMDSDEMIVMFESRLLDEDVLSVAVMFRVNEVEGPIGNAGCAEPAKNTMSAKMRIILDVR